MKGYSLTADYNPESSRGASRSAILEVIDSGNPRKVYELFEEK